MFVFSLGVTTFKGQLEGDAGREVDVDLAGGWLGGREVAVAVCQMLLSSGV